MYIYKYIYIYIYIYNEYIKNIYTKKYIYIQRIYIKKIYIYKYIYIHTINHSILSRFCKSPTSRLFTQILCRHRSKKTSKLCVISLCVGNSPMTAEFLAQRVSNAENVSIVWRHHVWYFSSSRSLTLQQQIRYNLRDSVMSHGKANSISCHSHTLSFLTTMVRHRKSSFTIYTYCIYDGYNP